MTEKRFTICVDSNDLKSLWDNERTEEEPLLWLTRSDRIGGIDDVCKLLNELHDINELFRHNIEEYRKLSLQFERRNNELITDNAFLEKENEQLKSEIEKLSYANEDLLSEKRNWQRMSDEYCKLSEENEQLKQQSNSVYEIVKEYVMSHHCKSTMRMLKKIEKVIWND